MAEGWLREALDKARAGALPEQGRTGLIFAEAAREWLRYVQEDRAAKPSTLSQYRSSVHAHFLPAFGDWPLEAVRAQWRRRPY